MVEKGVNKKFKYQDLVENMNDVIYMTDVNAVVTYISPVVESFTGYNLNSRLFCNEIRVLTANYVDF